MSWPPVRRKDLPEYRVWRGIRARCNTPRDPSYPFYGGRGIVLAAAWQNFAVFYQDMGPRPTPKHTIERIDNNGPYEKGNCCWATMEDQANNRRTSRFLSYKGKTWTVTQWARHLGIAPGTLYARLRHMPLPRALCADTYQRPSHLLTYKGETKTLTQWAQEVGINFTTLYERKKRGCVAADILTTARCKVHKE